MNPTPKEPMFSIKTTDGVKVTVGPDGKPFTTEKAAQASVDDRNARAEALGVKARYVVADSWSEA